MKSTVEPRLQVVNRDELIHRMMGSVQMAERMLRKFVDSSDSECDALESMVRMGNKSEIVSLAHRHKGTARTMSAERVANVAAELEQRAHTDSTSELLELVDQMRMTHQEVQQVIDDEFPAQGVEMERHTNDR